MANRVNRVNRANGGAFAGFVVRRVLLYMQMD